MLYYRLVKKKLKTNDRCSHDDDVRAGSGSPCTILLPCVVLHGRLIHLAHSARSFALSLADTLFQSVLLLPRLKKSKFSPQLAVMI